MSGTPSADEFVLAALSGSSNDRSAAGLLAELGGAPGDAQPTMPAALTAASFSDLFTRYYEEPPPPPDAPAAPATQRAGGRPQPEGGRRQAAAEERQRFTASVVQSRRPPPSGTTVEDVPGTGACLFHAIAMSQDPDAAR